MAIEQPTSIGNILQKRSSIIAPFFAFVHDVKPMSENKARSIKQLQFMKNVFETLTRARTIAKPIPRVSQKSIEAKTTQELTKDDTRE